MKTIVVWFSCGAASAVAAKKTVEIYGEDYNVLIVNNPVNEEDEDNRRFLKDVSEWIGLPVIEAKNDAIGTTSAYDVWEKRRYMSGVKGAPCTLLLKKAARYQFERDHDIDFHVLGFTADEKERHKKFILSERSNVLPVLIDLDLTKGDCFAMLEEEGIELPRVYKLGYPNANCIGCVKATSPTYWNHVRARHPEVFNQRAEQSKRLKCRLVRVKGKRIFLDELKTTDKGGKMKSHDCGIFCDTE
jgi:3'-phosphoadenosine 5'-phosphosulfate sulfotransferase (PAPS reductase)/FAD synthetase